MVSPLAASVGLIVVIVGGVALVGRSIFAVFSKKIGKPLIVKDHLSQSGDSRLMKLVRRKDLDGITKLLKKYREQNEAELGDPAKAIYHTAEMINKANSEGYTPLMEAVYNRLYDIAKVLVENGASTTAKNKFGQSAKTIAEDIRDEVMIDILV